MSMNVNVQGLEIRCYGLNIHELLNKNLGLKWEE